MRKITVIIGTNRPNSFSEKVSNYYAEQITKSGHEVQLFSLKELEGIITLANYFNKGNTAFDNLINKYISHTEAFVFVIPEYNGSFPGILKLFLDTVSPSQWENKNACIVGVSGGRAGNLRGIDHLTGVLNYLKMHVFHNKLPISQVDKIFLQSFPENEETAKAINKQIEGFLKFN